MILPRTSLAILALLGAAAGHAQVRIGNDPVPASVLPDDLIFVRNRSASDLEVWLSVNGGPWSRYAVNAAQTAVVGATALAVAISTSRTAEDPLADQPPGLAAAALPAPRHIEGAYAYSTFAGGSRAEFCWSDTLARWVTQEFGEGKCR